jgi:hypothetical protein
MMVEDSKGGVSLTVLMLMLHNKPHHLLMPSCQILFMAWLG